MKTKFEQKFIIFCFFGLLLSSSAIAKRFTNQYCEFELPSGWECILEGSEWICQSSNRDRQKEAIIIMAAKLRGSDDSLDKYQQYLKKQKTFKLPGGGTQVSESKWAKLSTVNKHRWVDSLHFASEIPGFYTRYMATVKADLGIVVTFSVGKDYYQSYQSVFEKMIASLRVFRQKDIDVADYKLKKQKEDLLEKSTFIPDMNSQLDISSQKKGRKGAGGMGDNMNLLLILLALGAAVFIFIKLKKKK